MANAEPPLVLLGIATVAHTHLLDQIHEFIASKTGHDYKSPQSFDPASFGKWAAAFTGMSLVIIFGSESTKWGETFTALAWLAAFGGAAIWYKDVLGLFIPQTGSVPGSSSSGSTPPSGRSGIGAEVPPSNQASFGSPIV